MNEYSTPRIQGFHAHVYFDAQSIERARALCEEAARRFPLKMGRVHERPVGPHPDWSCQLAFAPEVFGELVPWLAIHRQDLVVFIHPVTGNDLRSLRVSSLLLVISCATSRRLISGWLARSPRAAVRSNVRMGSSDQLVAAGEIDQAGQGMGVEFQHDA